MNLNSNLTNDTVTVPKKHSATGKGSLPTDRHSHDFSINFQSCNNLKGRKEREGGIICAEFHETIMAFKSMSKVF